MTLLIVLACLTVLISATCSLFEATLYSTQTGTLEAMVAEGRRVKGAKRFIRMKNNIAAPTSAILVLNTVANTAGATLCGMVAAETLGKQGVPIFSVALTLGILFVGEILPKTYGAVHWRSVWALIVWPLSILERVLHPVVVVTQRFADFFSGASGHPAVTQAEIEAQIRMGRRAGEVSAGEMELLSAVFRFDETLVRQVMTPRRDVQFFDVSWSLEECLDMAKRTRHTRYPLCRGALEDVVGLIHMKDLLGVAPDEQINLEAIARPIRHIPETMSISRLMREMQRTRQHMAVVDDEYGTVTGMVTMENVLEQIVGAVQDEFDSEAPDIVPDGSDTYKVAGRVLLERINRELGLDLEAPEAETLSGLLVTQIGRLVRAGDRIQLEGALAEVLEDQAGMATTVRLSIGGEIDEDETDASS